MEEVNQQEGQTQQEQQEVPVQGKKFGLYAWIIICVIIIVIVIIGTYSGISYMRWVRRKKLETNLTASNVTNQTDVTAGYTNAINYSGNGVNIVPVTLEQYLAHWFLPETSDEIDAEQYWTREWTELNSKAEPAGVDIVDYMDKKYMVSSKNRSYFAAFFEYKEAPTCDKEYLVQRAKSTRSYLYANGSNIQPDTEHYLVEVWRMTEDGKKTIAADQHTREYKLRIADSFRGQYRVEIEVGCGTIPDVIENSSWPYNDSVFEMLQDYLEDRGIYDEVDYNFSLKYEARGGFDLNGSYSMNVPALNISVFHI